MNLDDLSEKLITLRNTRQNLTQQITKVNHDIEILEQSIVDILTAQGLKTGNTAHARLTITEREIANLYDWDALCSYVRDNDAFYLLHKRISSTKVLELANILGQDIPGTTKLTTKSLSVTKR